MLRKVNLFCNLLLALTIVFGLFSIGVLFIPMWLSLKVILCGFFLGGGIAAFIAWKKMKVLREKTKMFTEVIGKEAMSLFADMMDTGKKKLVENK